MDAASSNTTVNIEVVVGDGTTATIGMTSMVVNKVNNGSATIGASIEVGSDATTLTATILSGDPDGNPGGAMMYQWQVCLANADCSVEANWNDIAAATGTPYLVMSSSPFLAKDNSFRTEASYIDGQGYSEAVYSQGQIYTPLIFTIGIHVRIFLEGLLQ